MSYRHPFGNSEALRAACGGVADTYESRLRRPLSGGVASNQNEVQFKTSLVGIPLGFPRNPRLFNSQNEVFV